MMTEQKIVYIVTEGSYSDYHICAVFDNEEDAQFFRDKFHADDIEQWHMNNNDELIRKYDIWLVYMDKKGNTKEAFVDNTSYSFRCAIEKQTRFDTMHNLYCHVFANSKEEAVKIVNEKRMQLLAEGTWR